jgi:predicted TIM-barrel fold metal-dependent hydrolase
VATVAVIDSDAHLIQQPDDSDIRAHMEKPYCDDKYPIFLGTGWERSACEGFGSSHWDTRDRLQAMDQEGIDLSVLMPTQALLVSQIPQRGLPTGFPRQVRDRNLAAAYCRAYNNYVAGICHESERLRAPGIVPLQNIAAAVAEAGRAVTELGLCGVVVSSLGLPEHLGSPAFAPLYAELETLKAPLLVHNLSHQVPLWQRFPDSFLFQDTVGGSMETLHAFTGLMYGGIAELFPNLRVAFLNIGVGWLPYIMERMDKDFASHGAEQAPLLKKLPSEYVKQSNWYYATIGDEGTLPYVLDWIGDDAVIFGSTYPDADSLFPNAVTNLRQRRDVSPEAKNKILSQNAQRLFGWH